MVCPAGQTITLGPGKEGFKIYSLEIIEQQFFLIQQRGKFALKPNPSLDLQKDFILGNKMTEQILVFENRFQIYCPVFVS